MGQGHVLVDAVDEKCILIGVIAQNVSEKDAVEYIDELEFLALTAGATTVQRFLQKMTMPNPKTFVGSGKLVEIRQFIDRNAVDVVIFDDELSPSQMRNIERVLETKILDRNNLILDIFASRARSANSKVQVELA